MGTDVLAVSDRLLAAIINCIYQGVVITAVVALTLRMRGGLNAATRHAVWLCTLVLLVVVAGVHGFISCGLVKLQTREIPETAALEWEAISTTSPVVPKANGSEVDPTKLPSEHRQPSGREYDSVSSDSLDLASSSEDSVFLSTTTGEARAKDPSIVGGQLKVSNTDNQSTWRYDTIRRLANPASLAFRFESRTARITGMILLCACLMWSAVRLIVLLVRLQQIRRLKRDSPPTSEVLNDLFRGLITRFDIRRRVELKASPTASSSFVLGFRHPVILLPPNDTMDRRETEQILRHELAHVQRYDDWANLVQHVILAMLPFHPAVRWICRQLSLEREIACDDCVLQSSAQPRAYALLLANLAARSQRCPPLLAPGASSNKTQLLERINMILDTRRNTSPRLLTPWLAFVTSAAGVLAVAIICSAPRIVLAQSEAPSVVDNAPSAGAPEGGAPVGIAPSGGIVAVALAPETVEADPANAQPGATPKPRTVGGPKFKPEPGQAVSIQPAVAPPAPAAPVPPSPVAVPTPAAPGAPFLATVQPAPEPPAASRSPRPARPVRSGDRDGSLEERLERLERMVESLAAQLNANAWRPMKGPAEANVIDRKEIAKAEAFAQRQAEIARKQVLNPKEIEKIKEHAQREGARANEQAKRATAEAEKANKFEQKLRATGKFKEGHQKQLEALRKQLEMLEREREKLDRQIEQLERDQEQLDEQRDEEQTRGDTNESNSKSLEQPSDPC